MSGVLFGFFVLCVCSLDVCRVDNDDWDCCVYCANMSALSAVIFVFGVLVLVTFFEVCLLNCGSVWIFIWGCFYAIQRAIVMLELVISFFLHSRSER